MPPGSYELRDFEGVVGKSDKPINRGKEDSVLSVPLWCKLPFLR